MLKHSLLISGLALAMALAISGPASAQGSAPNIAGTYRCVPEPTACLSPTFMVTQNGQNLEIRGENGLPPVGAKMTSNITMSAGPILNANGVLLPDRSIQWSNGTHWQKQ